MDMSDLEKELLSRGGEGIDYSCDEEKGLIVFQWAFITISSLWMILQP